jgi:hypothetical protein
MPTSEDMFWKEWQLVGSFPMRHATAFGELLKQVAPRHQTVYFMADGNCVIRISPALSPEQWEQWDHLYEEKCRELQL